MVFGTMLSFLDRLSTKSTLTGQTGSIVGLIATLGLIAVCVIIFINPIIQYFRYDFYQSQFTISSSEDIQYSSGRDFRIAIQWRNKLTNDVADHLQIERKLSIDYILTIPITTGIEQYFSTLQSCEKDYFQNTINPVVLEDCFIIPYDKLITSAGQIKISFKTKCNDPFNCRSGDIQSPQYQDSTNIFKDNYFILYFTSKVPDQSGNLKFVVHKVYSTEFENQNSISTLMNIFYYEQITEIDNSILPFNNTKTLRGLSYNGNVAGVGLDASEVSIAGANIYINIFEAKQYNYRYYKKLDWLIGTLGGGIFLFFLIFWVPCTYINENFQKMDTAKKLFIQLNEKKTGSINDYKQVSISLSYLALKCLPMRDRNQQLIRISQNKLSIVELIKKLKVAQRNVQMSLNKKLLNYPIDLEINQKNQLKYSDQISQKLQLNLQMIRILRQQPMVPKIYENNSQMLMIAEKTDNIDQNMEDQTYDKYNTYFPQKNVCLKWISWFLRLFDVFGAKPNFTTQPHNNSLFGLFGTMVIITLSILLFSVTIQNRNLPKNNIIFSTVPPLQSNLKLVTGQNVKMAVCFPQTAITNQIIVGINKKVQIQYYQYNRFRNGTQITETIPAIRLTEKAAYYTNFNSTDCFALPNDYNLTISGGPNEQFQSYFGLLIKPYCIATVQQCSSMTTENNKKFYDFISLYNMALTFPANLYNPQTRQIGQDISRISLLKSLTVRQNASSAFEQSLSFNTFSIIDDTDSTSLIRTVPNKTKSLLKFDPVFPRQVTRSINAPTYYYKLIIRSTGNNFSYISTAYKVDFLFGLVGGAFLFFYFFIHWLPKRYNSYKTRSKLSQLKYNQQPSDQDFKATCCHLSAFPICCFCGCNTLSNDVSRMRASEQKIIKDISYINLVKTVQNCWKLSSAFYPTLAAKNLSLVYLRQKIDQDEQVSQKIEVKKDNETDSDSDDMYDFEDDLQLRNHGRGTVTNQMNGMNIQPTHDNLNGNIHEEKINPAELYTEKLHDPSEYNNDSVLDKIKLFDVFNVKGELTLQGERSVRSVCGGICCMGLLILIILTSFHFAGLYLSEAGLQVSKTVNLALNPNEQRLQFNAGKNFKFMYTFYGNDQFYFKNISDFSNYFSIQAVKNNLILTKGQIFIKSETIDFIKCPQTYFDGFYGPYVDKKYYQNITNGYCLPDNTSLVVQGEPFSDSYKYFYFTISPKYVNPTNLTQVAAVNEKMKEFFNKTQTQYHFTVPVKDFRAKKLSYEIESLRQSIQPLTNGKSITQNISFEKYVLDRQDRDTGDRIILESYNYQYFSTFDNQDEYSFTDGRIWRNVTFNYNNRVTTFKIDTISSAEIFGMVGGIIAFYIFGIGCCVGSFNEYRMKYLIGQKLYIIQKGKKNKKQLLLGIKSRKRKAATENAPKKNNYSESDLLITWILSSIGCCRGNYNFNDKLKYITLIIQRVENDINFFDFCQKLQAIEVQLNKNFHFENKDIKLTKLYAKEIIRQNYQPFTLNDDLKKIAVRHQLSSYHQCKLYRAKQAQVNPTRIFKGKQLNKVFGIEQSQSEMQSQSNVQSTAMGKTSFKQKKLKEKNQMSSAKFNEEQSHGIDQYDM